MNSSSALVYDSDVVAGAPEERFNRQKFTRDFPHQAMEYCLRSKGLELSDCDAVAHAWNPGAAWQKFNPVLSKQLTRQRESFLYVVPDNLYRYADRTPGDWTCVTTPEKGGIPPVYYIQHHRCHAANAFFLSPFEEAAILTCDFRGEFECTTLSHGRDNKIDTLRVQNVPDSIGMFYSTFTEILGYRPHHDEWKVMALSAFPIDCAEMLDRIRGTYRLLDDGGLELDQSYYKGIIVDQPHLYTEKMLNVVGGRVGQSGESDTDWHHSVARAMQLASEEIALHFLNHLHTLTRCDNLVLSGGYFMNSVFNGKALELSPFKNLFIPYSPGDSGNSIGAALYVNHCLKGEARIKTYNPSEIGPSFGNKEILETLKRRKISYEKQTNMESAIARILAEGEIVAVFNGRMEFGERSLGNRSILADPRKPEIKEKINSAIKYRENYRPFAPAVLDDRVSEIFEVQKDFSCPYMEKVVSIRPQWRERLGAVCHVDGSGRVQTVNRQHNERFYNIIKAFGDLTEIPGVLNTSFNINGEPIVLSPDDALNTFFNSGLEFLALGDFLIRKSR